MSFDGAAADRSPVFSKFACASILQKKEDTYVTCMNGTLNLSTDSLHSAYSLPYVLLKRLFPMSEQLRLLLVRDVPARQLARQSDCSPLYSRESRRPPRTW